MALLLVCILAIEAFCYSGHFLDELRHVHDRETAVTACADACSASSLVAADGDADHEQGSHHEEGELCCHGHCHASILYDSLTIRHIPHVTLCRMTDPFRFIPEVYLDKFIPPQNLS